MVSIIVPVYKCENSLERCVRSILAQTYEDIEVILVDDGSPDGSGALCDRLAAQNGRIRVIHKENGGPSSARNRGLDAANGIYIQFVDSDDYIAPYMTQRLVERMERQDVQLVACGHRYVHEDWEEEAHFPDIPRVEIGEMTAKIPGFVARYFPNSPCTKLYMRKYADHRFDETVRLGEDLMFNLQYLAKIQAVSVVDMIPYYYVIDNPTSITGGKGLYRLTDTLACFKVAEAFYSRYGTREDLRQMANHSKDGVLYTPYAVLAAADYTPAQKKAMVKETLADPCVSTVLSLAELSAKQRLLAYGVRHRRYWLMKLLAALLKK